MSLVAHENSTSATGFPFASVASAARRSVSPATSVSAAGETATSLTSWATVTVAVPDAEPAIATIAAVPLPTAVTRPVELTVPTAVASLAQVTVAPAIAWPFWSRTSAESCTVAPSAASWAVAGLTVTVVGRGGSGGGGGGSVVPSPQPYNRAAPKSRAGAGTTIRIPRLNSTPILEPRAIPASAAAWFMTAGRRTGAPAGSKLLRSGQVSPL